MHQANDSIETGASLIHVRVIEGNEMQGDLRCQKADEKRGSDCGENGVVYTENSS